MSARNPGTITYNISLSHIIWQISDIYYGSTINKSDIKKIVKKINENNIINQCIKANVANREISVVDSIVVSSEQSTTKFYVDLTVDAVAYNGNIYKKTNGLTQNQIDNLVGTPDLPVLAYPFGSKDTLPSTWTAWQ